MTSLTYVQLDGSVFPVWSPLVFVISGGLALLVMVVFAVGRWTVNARQELEADPAPLEPPRGKHWHPDTEHTTEVTVPDRPEDRPITEETVRGVMESSMDAVRQHLDAAKDQTQVLAKGWRHRG
jgi:hypothetical protein